MRVDAYLDRIHYKGPSTPTAETLRGIHRAHLMAVPFENLDIHLGVPIVLSVPAFYEKIVTRQRGGFCYELNGLFAWLLGELGFRVTLLSARVTSSQGLSPDFDHLLLLLVLEDRWIADVGFGDSSLEPLRPGLESGEGGDRYAISNESATWTMQRHRNGVWEPQYTFSLAPRRLDEFAERCRFQQVSPESHFTHSTICSLPTPVGRISLSGRKFIVTTVGRREEREVGSAKEYRRILLDDFGIELAKPDVDRLMTAGVRP
jgi:N-hydroxyarylamine O-acetyltransferase